MSERFHVFALVLFALFLFPACKEKKSALADAPQLKAYDVEQDWNDPQRTILLNYQQAQGKRIFYSACVWCHADVTPAGPSNRSNVIPPPPLINDGNVLNSVSDDALQNIIALGGGAVGKSSMMPPWGRTLTQGDIRALIAFIRVVSQPPYQAPARPAP
jgi:cytochrome c oxidase cbb3-type subunit 3